VIVRLLIWGLADSNATIEELRGGLPALEPPSKWVWNEAGERFGIVAFGDELPEGLGWARDLIGDDPDVYEEFDAVEL
jgi:hypothetical protein